MLIGQSPEVDRKVPWRPEFYDLLTIHRHRDVGVVKVWDDGQIDDVLDAAVLAIAPQDECAEE